MRSHSTLVGIIAFIFAGLLSVGTAYFAVGEIEERSTAAVEQTLSEQQMAWAHVDVDGLQIIITGTAPTEAARFRALTSAGTVIDASRITDSINVREAENITTPHFSIEILQNTDGISLIGLIPAEFDRENFLENLRDATEGTPVVDFLQEAHYPAPEGWDQALLFGYRALSQLERSKISLSANSISITAVSNSQEQRAELEKALRRAAPQSAKLYLVISAPRPVLTPFALRFVLTDGVARFDACAADTITAQARILAAAQAAGLKGQSNCTLGLGVPTTRWSEAVETAIKALQDLGGGSLSFADADVTLVAAEGTDTGLYTKIIAELEADLPPLFSLKATLPKVAETDEKKDAIIDFVATLSPEGQVQLRGWVPNDRVRKAAESYAMARFSRESVYAPISLDPDLPSGWPMRVFSGLAALAELNHGSVVVAENSLTVKGVTGNLDTNAKLAAMLAHQLPPRTEVFFDVVYNEALDPIAALPSPEECVASINAVIQAKKISFAPGADTIASEANRTIEQIAALMEDCESVPMEIAGHTDSQGRETMNYDLSQARAEAVVNALMARRVLTGNLTPRGYGETTPIADNETADGREDNRRIEFTLIVPQSSDATQEEGPAAAQTPTSTEPTQDDAPTENEQEATDEQN